MAALVKQYSRISHHTLAGLTGSTFSVPTQEDFTDSTTPWTIYDLALSEFGVNEADKKLYIRIADEIKEIGFAATMSLSENLEQTLALGNNMGTYSIIMDTGKLLSAGQTSSITLTDFENRIVADQITTIPPIAQWSQDNTYVIKEIQSSGSSQERLFEILNASFPTESVLMIEANIQALDSTNMLYYFNKMLATFWCSGGVITQVGTNDINERTNMSTGFAIIDHDGSDVYITVEGDAGSNLYWTGRINYQITGSL